MRVRRTLLITNDFPPRVGGIQSYVHELARRLPPDSLVVLASDHPGASSFDAAQDFPVVRYPTSMLLPTPGVAGRAEQLIDRHRLDAVWYGAAAPLGLLTTRLRRTGRIRRVVASTHGHEVGWSMLPVARQMLRRIGTTADVITYVSSYARRRISSALGRWQPWRRSHRGSTWRCSGPIRRSDRRCAHATAWRIGSSSPVSRGSSRARVRIA